MIKLHQGQHRRRDLCAARHNAIGRHHNFTPTADCRRECRQARLAEQHAHVRAQADLAHAFDQADRQQRVPAQLEEMIMAPDAFKLEHVLPDLRQHGFHFTFRGFVATAEQRTLIRHRQALAVQLAIGGKR